MPTNPWHGQRQNSGGLDVEGDRNLFDDQEIMIEDSEYA